MRASSVFTNMNIAIKVINTIEKHLPCHCFLQSVLEEGVSVAHRNKLVLRVPRTRLFFGNLGSLAVGPLVGQFGGNGGNQTGQSERETQSEAGRVGWSIGVEEHVAAHDATSVSDADVQTEADCSSRSWCKVVSCPCNKSWS